MYPLNSGWWDETLWKENDNKVDGSLNLFPGIIAAIRASLNDEEIINEYNYMRRFIIS